MAHSSGTRETLEELSRQHLSENQPKYVRKAVDDTDVDQRGVFLGRIRREAASRTRREAWVRRCVTTRRSTATPRDWIAVSAQFGDWVRVSLFKDTRDPQSKST